MFSTNVETEFRCCPSTLGMTSNLGGASCRANKDSSGIIAPVIVARYQSTDTAVAKSWSSILGRAVSSTTSSRSSTAISGQDLSSIASTSPTSSQVSSNSSSSGLSAGAIAGIVIGAIAGFLLLLGCLLALLRWRKRQHTTTKANPTEQRKWNDDSDQRRWAEAGESRQT